MQYFIQAKVSDNYGRTVESVSSIAHFIARRELVGSSTVITVTYCICILLYLIYVNIHFIDGR